MKPSQRNQPASRALSAKSKGPGHAAMKATDSVGAAAGAAGAGARTGAATTGPATTDKRSPVLPGSVARRRPPQSLLRAATPVVNRDGADAGGDGLWKRPKQTSHRSSRAARAQQAATANLPIAVKRIRYL